MQGYTVIILLVITKVKSLEELALKVTYKTTKP